MRKNIAIALGVLLLTAHIAFGFGTNPIVANRITTATNDAQLTAALAAIGITPGGGGSGSNSVAAIGGISTNMYWFFTNPVTGEWGYHDTNGIVFKTNSLSGAWIVIGNTNIHGGVGTVTNFAFTVNGNVSATTFIGNLTGTASLATTATTATTALSLGAPIVTNNSTGNTLGGAFTASPGGNVITNGGGGLALSSGATNLVLYDSAGGIPALKSNTRQLFGSSGVGVLDWAALMFLVPWNGLLLTNVQATNIVGTLANATTGNATTATTAVNFSGALSGNVTGTQGATVVSSVGSASLPTAQLTGTVSLANENPLVLTNDSALAAIIASNSMSDQGAVSAMKKFSTALISSGQASHLLGFAPFGARFNPQNLGIYSSRGVTEQVGATVQAPVWGDQNAAVFTNNNGLDWVGFSVTNYLLVIVWQQPADPNTEGAVEGSNGNYPPSTANAIASMANGVDNSENGLMGGVNFGNKAALFLLCKTNGTGTNFFSHQANYLQGGYTLQNAEVRMQSSKGARHVYPPLVTTTAVASDCGGHQEAWNDAMFSVIGQSAATNYSAPLFATNFTQLHIGYDTNLNALIFNPALTQTFTNYYGKIRCVFLWDTTNAALVDLSQTLARYTYTETKDMFIYGTSMLDPQMYNGSPFFIKSLTNTFSYWFQAYQPDTVVHDYSEASASATTLLTNTVTVLPLPLNPVRDVVNQSTVTIEGDIMRNNFNGVANQVIYGWYYNFFAGINAGSTNIVHKLLETYMWQTNDVAMGGPSGNETNLLAGWYYMETNAPIFNSVAPIYQGVSQIFSSNNFADGVHPTALYGNDQGKLARLNAAAVRFALNGTPMGNAGTTFTSSGLNIFDPITFDVLQMSSQNGSISANGFSGNGSGLTNLNVSTATGTLPAASLSSSAAQTNAANQILMTTNVVIDLTITGGSIAKTTNGSGITAALTISAGSGNGNALTNSSGAVYQTWTGGTNNFNGVINGSNALNTTGYNLNTNGNANFSGNLSAANLLQSNNIPATSVFGGMLTTNPATGFGMTFNLGGNSAYPATNINGAIAPAVAGPMLTTNPATGTVVPSYNAGGLTNVLSTVDVAGNNITITSTTNAATGQVTNSYAAASGGGAAYANTNWVLLAHSYLDSVNQGFYQGYYMTNFGSTGSHTNGSFGINLVTGFITNNVAGYYELWCSIGWLSAGGDNYVKFLTNGVLCGGFDAYDSPVSTPATISGTCNGGATYLPASTVIQVFGQILSGTCSNYCLRVTQCR